MKRKRLINSYKENGDCDIEMYRIWLSDFTSCTDIEGLLYCQESQRLLYTEAADRRCSVNVSKKFHSTLDILCQTMQSRHLSIHHSWYVFDD